MYPEGKADSEYSIPQKITTIRGSAFYQCKKLSSVVIPDSITEIGYSAFYQCNNLEQVVLSNNIKALRDTVFYNCTSLNNISIPDGVASIGYRTFYNCASLVSATIPDSVTSFDTGAFSGCDALTIRCNAGSAAHMYAIDNNIPYAFIGGAETFTVVFKDGNTVIETQSVEMFKDASAPRLKRPAYVLSWDKPFYYITGDLTVNAVWTPDPLFGKDVFVSVAVSGYHTLGLKSDGSLWVWGWSMLNGIGTTARPTFVMGNVSMIAAGDCNSMIVKMDGSLWVCGDDGVGAVGDGTTEIRDTFVKVMDDVIAISSGYRFSLAIKSDYTLWAWGFNENGELGDGTTVNKTRPVKILDNVESVSAGYNHSLAVKRDGTLVGWGDNSRGQIGNGKEGGNETRPVQVMNNVLSCSAAGRFSMAIKKDATLWGWGDNWDGQICGCYYWLGAVRRSTEELSPVKIMDDVSSVSAIGRTYLDSFRCTMAIKKDGSLWKWGGERGENAIPIRIGENTSQITGSEKSFALIRTDGSLWMWGGNVYGQLGDGTRESSGIPNKIDPGSSKTIETWGRNGVVRETREPESKVILAAIPNPGYWFEGWYESGAKIFGAEAVYSFNLAASRAMEARFLPLAVSSIDQNTTFAVQGTASDYLSFYSELPMVQTYISRENKIYVMNIDYYTTDNPASAEIFQYSPEMALLKKIVVSSGEPSFLPGAFVVDESGNIFVFYAKGANAYDEHNMMVVKYSPSGEELSRFSLNARPSDSYYGVRLPFNASGCRMEISGDYIAVYFGREMFVSGDGQNHQASYGFIINKNSMERLQGYSIPYVSHSMNQFILPLQNGAFLFADHGDGNPRAFAFEKIDPQNLNRNDKINSFVFKGNNGQNETLAEMGGLSKTSAGYIFAGTYDKSSGMDYIAGPRNLFVLIMNESLNVISQPVWLTNYGEFESACRPKIVRLGVDRFLLLWERVDNAKMDYRFTATGRKCETFAMMIDKDGNVLQPARKIQDDALTANDVLRYNPATQRVYWAVKNGDKSIKICSLDPEQVWGSGSSVMLGDVNGDGELDIGDVNLLYMYVRSKATLTGDALLAADVNDDGDIDIGDVNMLYMYIRGKIPSIG
jgi:alpha-tubulin suppressor-like RCC1 family protein